MEAIETQNAEVEEIGGPLFARIDPEAINKPFTIKVLEYKKVKTEWGTRYDFGGVDNNGFDIGFSSWNIVSKSKMKPDDMIGKTYLVEKYNEKRFKISLI